MNVLKARVDLPDNADPILVIDAMEALHSDKSDSLSGFALELHKIGAAQFYSVGVTTVNFLTIKGMEARTGNPGGYLKDAIDYIQSHGTEFSERHSVDPRALNSEVDLYLKETLMPVLNGVANLSLNFPNDAPEHTRQYVLALTYVTYAFFVTAHLESTGESEISFESLREQIINRSEKAEGGISNPHSDPDVPQEPLETSHFGEIHRSNFVSPAHEATSTVDVTIPIQLSEYYGASDENGMREVAADIVAGRISIDEIFKPVLHFCRAVLIIVFNMTNEDERDSYMAAANANITKAQREGLVTNRFGVSQKELDIATKNILLSLSSLMANHGAFYEGALPDPEDADYAQLVHAYVVSMGMITDAYSVLVTGRLGLDKQNFDLHLRKVLS